MTFNIILAGIGGQGVIYATKVISQAGLASGRSVLASENHGMSQRGGSVLAHVKLGVSQAPLVRRGAAQALVAFDRGEALRNLAFLAAGGALIVNSPQDLDPAIVAGLAAAGVTRVWRVDADQLARELGSPAAANLVTLGFAAAQGSLDVSIADLESAVRTLGPEKSVTRNLQALQAGVAQAAPVSAD